MIETPRLLLRRFEPGDAPALSVYRSEPEIARYQAWPSPLSADEADAAVRDYSKADPEQPGWFQYAIELKADRSLAGDLGINLHDNQMQAELGVTLAPAFHGKGYALEALHGILGHLFDRGLHHVRATCDARNTASARLLERTGFELEGCSTGSLWQRGEWTDLLLFGLLARNWKPQNFTSQAAEPSGRNVQPPLTSRAG
ncbi:GNAT family N-acetyltransferase [Streptomyces sp. 4.24]|uniref:GNAT family N-acetyltransferase n=1 Tax=Streptomyces tritrimontium TaxID=3406573 RepID=UPI003BB7975B